MRLSPRQDAFGKMLLDAHSGASDAAEWVERDDGFLDHSADASVYLAAPKHVWKTSGRVLRQVRGRVLDLGCGGGRFALALQERGHDVLAIDVSPLAVRTTRLRGVRRARVMPVTQVDRRLGSFETLIMLGNNFGLMANPRRARWLLRRFRGLTPDGGRILAQSLDIYRTEDPVHLRYQRENRRRGRMSGQIRMRIRYRELATPFFDYLMVSPAEMSQIVEGTGWEIRRFTPTGGNTYVALLEKLA
jgi:SAM-dependent methyltransferase